MKYFFLLSLFIFNLSYAQEYSEIDASAKKVKYKGSIKKLTEELIQNTQNEFEKTRAIYIWITENIAYDYRAFNKNKKPKKVKCKTTEVCNLKRIQLKKKYIQKVITSKKAVCQGYSELFQIMCSYANIKAKVVPGFVKRKPYQIGGMGILDHAWNLVFIDGNPYFFDTTWAAGYCTKNKRGKLNGFVKDRNKYYWLTPIDKFSRNHYPKDSTILNNKLSRNKYKNQAFIAPSLFEDLTITSPNSGVLEYKVGDTIQFRFKYSKTLTNNQINTNLKRNPKLYVMHKNRWVYRAKLEDKQEYITYDRKEDEYNFTYIIKNEKLTYIEFLSDYEVILKFKMFLKE